MSTPISRQEVRAACENAASRFGLPYAWVKHHVDKKAGKVCYRCDGDGEYQGIGECYRCQGTGGTSREAVEDALYWVEENRYRVSQMGEKREQGRQQLQAQWKEQHPRHWWALRNMEPSSFKQYLMECLENVHRGRMRPHMERLLQIADEIEAVQKGSANPAPGKGSLVDVPVSIRQVYKAPFSGVFSEGTTTILFDTDEGWSGRVETTDLVTLARIEHRQDDYPHITGVIKWSKGAKARLGDVEFYWPRGEE